MDGSKITWNICTIIWMIFDLIPPLSNTSLSWLNTWVNDLFALFALHNLLKVLYLAEHEQGCVFALHNLLLAPYLVAHEQGRVFALHNLPCWAWAGALLSWRGPWPCLDVHWELQCAWECCHPWFGQKLRPWTCPPGIPLWLCGLFQQPSAWEFDLNIKRAMVNSCSCIYMNIWRCHLSSGNHASYWLAGANW